MRIYEKRPRTACDGRGHGNGSEVPMRGKPNRGACSIEGCERDAWARGWCPKHYTRWSKHGDPTTVIERWPPTEDRFWANVSISVGFDAPTCWEWTGSRAGGTGYGQFHDRGRATLAHRYAYELLVGPIPDGLVIDHLCRNRACVNPAHMEPVTHRENILRGTGASARAARVTHCPQGHPYDAENTATRADGSRRCKTCHRDRERNRRAA